MLVSRKQQKTRKVVETVEDDSMLGVGEETVEQYVDADLTEYSSPSQSEQKSSVSEQQGPPTSEKPVDARPQTVTSGVMPVDASVKVELPEGL